jgi:SAM-dependent methyltransferase
MNGSDEARELSIAVAREQRLVFGEVAELYDRVRPGYPPSLVDHVLASVELTAGDPVLEVGAGTGKATVAFGARGLAVHALEPDAEMAALARRNCALPGMEVVVTTSGFEDWVPDRRDYELVMSAQAWHWVRPGERIEKAYDVIAPRGALALFWNRPDWPDTPLRRAIDEVYDLVAPDLGARTPGRSPQDAGRRACTDELAACEQFAAIEYSEHPWTATYDTASYLELLSTQSDHRMLDPDRRRRLLDGVAAVIDAAGGSIAVAYAADLYVARRSS